ncbi:MAG: hypothetical protein ACREQY_10610 [Candidatus Binatia bacterium]
MNRTSQALCLLSGAAVGAGLMYVLDPDRGAVRRTRLRRRAQIAGRWASAKANEAAREAAVASKDLLHEAAVVSKDLFEEARRNPFVASILPERKSLIQKLLSPDSRSGQLAVVLLGTAIAATGGTLAARTIGAQPAVH